MTAIDTPATRQLNLEAALQSMVLLKNDKVNGSARPLLPILAAQTVALLGPHVNSTQAMLSNYCPGHWWAVSPLEAAREMLGERLVGSAQGCTIEGNDTTGINAAVELAAKADVAVILVGLTPDNDAANAGTPPVVASESGFEGEGHDRTNITLQGQQEELIRQVVAVNPRTIVVLIHGGALAIENVRDLVPAILDAHYPGQQGGPAILRTLLNIDGAAPAGRLTTTYYKADFVQRNMTDMSLNNITYRYYTGSTLWDFGFGESYSTFTVEWINVTRRVSTADLAQMHTLYYTSRAAGKPWRSPAAYTAKVTNTGPLSSDYVVLGFLSSSSGRDKADPHEPAKELFDFGRVSLAPGASAVVHFSIPPSVISHVDKHGVEQIQAGEYTVTLGGERLGGAVPISSKLNVEGPDQTLFDLASLKRK